MQHPDRRHNLALAALIVSSALVIAVATAWGVRSLVVSRIQANAQTAQTAANAIGGFPLTGTPAPDFNLTDQFGQTVTLSSLRGHEIVLAFIDSQCKTLCPLTATIMYDAKMKLGVSAANQVSLIAINANPTATSVASVQAWSIEHGMLHQWLFLTGPAQQLQAIYHQYGVYDQVTDGQAVHDPVTFIIDPSGHERLYFETLDSSSKLDLSDQETGLVAGMRQWLP